MTMMVTQDQSLESRGLRMDVMMMMMMMETIRIKALVSVLGERNRVGGEMILDGVSVYHADTVKTETDTV